MSVLLTALFAGTAVGYALLGVWRRGDASAGVGDVLHVVMSAAMLSMPWSWGPKVAPPMVQVIVFGLATAYFLVLLVGGDRFASHTQHGVGGERQVLLGYHALMMAAMAVMGLMMRDMHGSAGSDHSMPGMSMGGPSMPKMSMHLGTGWTALSWVLVAMFSVATCALLVRWLRTARRRARGEVFEAGLLVLMSAGMALAFVPAW
ncbi:DUF5134 domain-containing protein [Flexivirga caeni]|uniref:DUF5134 domain-containing protein n=1 Tax=Flexivirga caeni TaxID=2294115 RepID=UPI000F44DD6C|nr:DUF5134 domain-containing protein [Flexivirga caeni]